MMVDRIDQIRRYLDGVDMSGWERTVRRFFEANVITEALPEKGAVVELGTAKGVTFQWLSDCFSGRECVGFDVVNYPSHPNIRERDVRALGPDDDIPAALVFNDLSDWEGSPESKSAGLAYALRNVVPGGLYVDAAFTARGRTGANRALEGFDQVTEVGLFVLYRRQLETERRAPSGANAAATAVAHGTKALSSTLATNFFDTPDGARVLAKEQRDDPSAIAIARAFVGAPAVPPAIRQSEVGGWTRFDEQVRSLAFDVTQFDADAKGVLVVKGSEPALDDFDALIGWMERAPFRTAPQAGHRPMIDHFPLREGKVPGCMTVDEAIKDADAAMMLQQRSLDAYGSLLRVPIPVAVMRHPDDVVATVVSKLGPHLSRASADVVESAVANGLGMTVSLYPGYPVRARSFCAAKWGETEDERLRRMHTIDVEGTVDSWVALVARMFHLGFVPYTFQNEGLGACFDAGNACVDGGMMDVDSVVPLTDCRDDGEVYDAVVATKLGLERTVSLLFSNRCHAETKQDFIGNWLQQKMATALRAEAPTQQPTLLDERVRHVFEAQSFATLEHALSSRQRDVRRFFDAAQ